MFFIICSNNYQINLFCYIYFHVHLRKHYCVFSFFRKIVKIPSDKRGEIQHMLVGMFKRVYKEKVKEINIIASQEDASQQQRASEVHDHSFILLCTLNLIIICIILILWITKEMMSRGPQVVDMECRETT